MNQECWNPGSETGFLINPDPLENLAKIETGFAHQKATELEDISEQLPRLVKTGEIRPVLSELDIHDVSVLEDCSALRVVERAFQIYSHFANAYVWCDEGNPTDHIPEGVAIPLVQLANIVERPPILPYATTSLCNFKRINPDGEIRVDNLQCIQKIVGIPDESWFHLIHVEIEAHAAKAIQACITASKAIDTQDGTGVREALSEIPGAFVKMMKTFNRMGEHCKPEVYYFTLRPYLFGFNNIIYKGVDEYEGKPQTFRGESGAQSTVIPAIKAYLGLQHERGGLSEHLEIMKNYMPKPHRELIANIDAVKIRNFVINCDEKTLTDKYNACLKSVFAFRSLHLKMVAEYVSKRVENPIGTGGTEFMHWLKKLRDETAQQYLN